MQNNFEDIVLELYNKLKNLKFSKNKIVVLDKIIDAKSNSIYDIQKNIYQKNDSIFKFVDIASPSLDNHFNLLKTYKTIDFTDKDITIEIVDKDKTFISFNSSTSVEIFSKNIIINSKEYKDIFLKFDFDYVDSQSFINVRNIYSNTFEDNLIPSAYISLFENKVSITHQPTYNTRQTINISIKIVDYLDNISVDDYISGLLKIRLTDAIILVNNIEVNNKIKLDIGTLNSNLVKLLNFNINIVRHKNYSEYNDLIYCHTPNN